MAKATMQGIEKLINQLMKDSKELGVSVSGAVSKSGGQLLGFDNKVANETEAMSHIRALVHAKGDINEFLCTVSHTEYHFSMPLEDRAAAFTETNPQIFSTVH